MAEIVPDVNEQQLQYIISDADWEYRPVLDKIAQDVDTLIGGDGNTSLNIDETSFIKKGKKSVGVARQWCGRLGKVENCQVAVFAALANNRFTTLIDERLYLPEEWTKDKKRCIKAGIPESEIVQKSKAEIAFEMVTDKRKQGIRFAWTGFDGGYGKDPGLLRKMDTAGEIFMADVHCDQRIYLEDPRPQIPASTSSRGRQPTRLKAQTKAIRVDQWASQQAPDSWQRLEIRESTKGTLKADFLHQRVWSWDGKEVAAHCWHLVVRKEIQSPDEIKYSLSNAVPYTSTQRLAFMQGQRFWVEHALKNGKSHSGLADYQVRSWRGWHHHVAFVLTAMLFMLSEQLESQDSFPLLSCSDIEGLLKHFLPKKKMNQKEVLQQMILRHEKRQRSIDYARLRQKTIENQQ